MAKKTRLASTLALVGTDLADTLRGGLGDDTLDGGADNDLLLGKD
jgi:Ca2+-binding RTX toxin-like protein